MAGPVKTVATNADRRTDLRLLAGAEFAAGRYECGFTSPRISGRPALSSSELDIAVEPLDPGAAVLIDLTPINTPIGEIGLSRRDQPHRLGGGASCGWSGSRRKAA